MKSAQLKDRRAATQQLMPPRGAWREAAAQPAQAQRGKSHALIALKCAALVLASWGLVYPGLMWGLNSLLPN